MKEIFILYSGSYEHREVWETFISKELADKYCHGFILKEYKKMWREETFSKYMQDYIRSEDIGIETRCLYEDESDLEKEIAAFTGGDEE